MFVYELEGNKYKTLSDVRKEHFEVNKKNHNPFYHYYKIPDSKLNTPKNIKVRVTNRNGDSIIINIFSSYSKTK